MSGACTSIVFLLFIGMIAMYQVVEFVSFVRASEVLIDFDLED
jgi:hypothetical protein